MKKKGRNSKYKPEYCKKIVKFFSEDPYKEKEVTKTSKKGEIINVFERIPNDIPYISAFAREIGVCVDTINEWSHKHRRFSVALKKAKELQKEFLITNGLLGLYNSTFAIFTAQNITDMRNQKQVEMSIIGQVGVIQMPAEKELEIVSKEKEKKGKGNMGTTA